MGVYVLYYHRICPKAPASDVILPLFDWEMSYLCRRFQILSSSELIDYINGDLILERPGVAITFDDGWFDNFVYAWPVLKKYGIKAPVFVSTGKIRTESSVRPTLEECWNGRLVLDILQRPKSVEEGFLGALSGDLSEFLTWEELRVMRQSGVFDIQSHGVEHRKVFCGDRPDGVIKGKISWSLLSANTDIKEGMPVYPAKSALTAKVYYPDGHGSGIWETEDEMKERIMGELVESRDRIYSETGVKPIHFCWPWGQYSDIGIELAKEAGYEACYTTKAGTVTSNIDRFCIPRISTKGGKMTFIKRGLVYSNPYVSKVYEVMRSKE